MCLLVVNHNSMSGILPHFLVPLQEVIAQAIFQTSGTSLSSINLQHDVSCDYDHRCQAWIRDSQRVGMFIENLKETADTVAFDKWSAEFKQIPRSTVVFCSWVCHDV